MTPLYIVEAIHTRGGDDIINRYPTLFFPQEAMTERTIRIFAGLQKPFEKHAADFVLYRLEGHAEAGQWRIYQVPGEKSPRSVWEPHSAHLEVEPAFADFSPVKVRC